MCVYIYIFMVIYKLRYISDIIKMILLTADKKTDLSMSLKEIDLDCDWWSWATVLEYSGSD